MPINVLDLNRQEVCKMLLPDYRARRAAAYQHGIYGNTGFKPAYDFELEMFEKGQRDEAERKANP